MKYWITGAGIYRALEDHVPVSEGSVEITEQQYLDWQNRPEKEVERLKAELQAIEQAEIMPRKSREIQIQLMEFMAEQQGITPEQLEQNPAYAGLKAIDAQCAALRKQIQDILLNYE